MWVAISAYTSACFIEPYVMGTYGTESLPDLIRPAFENGHCSEEAGDQAGCRNELVGADLWHD